MITNSSPLSDILHDVISYVCVTNKSPLPICGTPSNRLMIHVHAKPPNLPEQIILANEIRTHHSQLHDSSRFKIIRNIHIHPQIITNPSYLTKATGSIPNCLGFLFDSFDSGDPRLMGLFHATRETSFLTLDQLTSRIVQLNNTIINLTPSPLPFQPQSPPALRSTTNQQQSSRGRGRGPPLAQHRAHTTDRSAAYFHVASTSPLSLHSNTSHNFYTIINGVGGIAVANIYSMDFDNNGICTMITHIPFNQHKSFTTHQEAWTFFVAFFPHIKSPNEATFMNENCPCEASNLTNPSWQFQNIQGLHFIPPSRDVKELFHYDHLPANIKEKRHTASLCMQTQDCSPINGLTFIPSSNPPSTTTNTTYNTTTHAPPPPLRPSPSPLLR
jgi:hypothetical protein